MIAFRYTLVTDGPSDRSLKHIIDWLLRQIPEISSAGFSGQFADSRRLEKPPTTLTDKLSKAIEQFPCEVLFVHRDAEGDVRQKRVDEILEAAKAAGISPHVPVVPVRMTEAWLLIEEQAIRTAAGNPNGTVELDMPPTHSLEGIPNPKGILQRLLLGASELTGRRLHKFRREVSRRTQRVAELVGDYSALRQLPAFKAFENDTRNMLRSRRE